MRAVLYALVAIATLVSLSTAGRINFVLLGATGNLAEKYLWQGLYNIHKSGLKTGNTVHVYPAATKEAAVAAPMLQTILDENITAADADSKAAFLKDNVSQYVQLRDSAQYAELGKLIEEDLQQSGEEEVGRLFYLSVPPKFFGSIAKEIHSNLRPKGSNAWVKVIVEKPFGVDLESAEKLADGIFNSLTEDEVLLVDHYMGKSVLHGIREFGKLNPIDTFLGSKKISHVEVGMLETEDCEDRTSFYDEVGVIRDTMQNHLMMMFALLEMDLSYSNRGSDRFESEADARVEVFQRLEVLTSDEIVVLGQYASYNDHVNEERTKWNQKELEQPSRTPTYAHIVLKIANPQSLFHAVPIHFKSGKALDVRRSYVEVMLEDGSYLVFNLQGPSRQGESGAFILSSSSLGRMNLPNDWKVVEKPGVGFVAHAPETPSAYEVLLRAALEGDDEHFVRLEEVLESWKIWTPLLEYLGSLDGGAQLVQYQHGTPMHVHGQNPQDSQKQHDEL